MIVLMQFGATDEQVKAVCDTISAFDLKPLVLPGDRVAIGIPSAIPSEARDSLEMILSGIEGVSKVTQVSRPYKLASLEWQHKKTTVEVKGVKIGPGHFVSMGGPCSVESYEQFSEAARLVKAAGSTILRGGAFKPRTSPYAFQGLADEGLRIIKPVGDEFGL